MIRTDDGGQTIVQDYPASALPIPYPPHPGGAKRLVLLWRLGFGPIIGRRYLILTTTGRKTGHARSTALDYHTWKRQIYVVSVWGEQAQWYRNLLANPFVTIQTKHGTEYVRARRITDQIELMDAYKVIRHSRNLRRWAEVAIGKFDEQKFLENRDRRHILTFDPTREPTPPPVTNDLVWVWEVLVTALLVRQITRVGKSRRSEE